MPNFAAFLAPLVLLLPLPVAEDSAAPDLADHNTDLTPEPPETMPEAPAEWLMIEGANGMPAQYQVRIEQRVVIRVSPRRPAVRENLNADLPRRSRR